VSYESHPPDKEETNGVNPYIPEIGKPVPRADAAAKATGTEKYAVASMAALLRLSPTGEIEAIRLAWGSVGPTVVTATTVEDSLIGEKLSPETLAAVAVRIRQIVAPIDDVRASADYRRTVSGNLLLRLLNAPLDTGSPFIQ
jgi:CO/xanthine dehydrogenase FAD-binding subunit